MLQNRKTDVLVYDRRIETSRVMMTLNGKWLEKCRWIKKKTTAAWTNNSHIPSVTYHSGGIARLLPQAAVCSPLKAHVSVFCQQMMHPPLHRSCDLFLLFSSSLPVCTDAPAFSCLCFSPSVCLPFCLSACSTDSPSLQVCLSQTALPSYVSK